MALDGFNGFGAARPAFRQARQQIGNRAKGGSPRRPEGFAASISDALNQRQAQADSMRPFDAGGVEAPAMSAGFGKPIRPLDPRPSAKGGGAKGGGSIRRPIARGGSFGKAPFENRGEFF